MQPLNKTREVSTGGVVDSTSFRISEKNQEKIKAMLRKGIYSDKPLAPMREYSANAWDAHRMSGEPDRPIKVVIPTFDNPVLIIEDYGPGLSHEKAFSLFTSYGETTKEETNDAVGYWGIGSKSGFAYSDTFMVISRYGGKKRTYVAKLDENEKDSFDLLLEEDWDGPTGLTIQIPVRKEDINEFRRKATEFFQYFTPRPDINIDLPPVPAIKSKLQHGIIFDEGEYNYYRSKSSTWIAIMGCVPYKIELDQLKDQDGKSQISPVFRNTSGLLEFPVGSIQINVSREGLEYSKVTKKALVAKFGELLDEYVSVMLTEIESTTSTNWERRIKAQQLVHLGLTDKEVGDWAETQFRFKNTVTFEVDRAVHFNKDVMLVRDNDSEDRSIYQYNNLDRHNRHLIIKPKAVTQLSADGSTQIPVVPTRFYTWAEIEVELQRIIVENKLDGIPIKDITEFEYYTPPPKPVKIKPKRISGPKNVKHVKRVFKLVDPPKSVNKLSDHWEVAEITPSPDDVYVIIKEFQEATGLSIPNERIKDMELAKVFGIILPPIYAYKSTEKNPVDSSKVVGIHYLEWRRKFHASLRQHHTVKWLIENYQWLKITLPYSGTDPEHPQKVIDDLKKALGEKHIIPTLFTKALAVRKRGLSRELEGRRIRTLTEYDILPKGYLSEAERILLEIKKRYPLLEGAEFQVLWAKSRARHWRQYIRLIDNKKGNTP